MTQRYQGEVAKELPEVDGILGTGSYKDIVDAVETVMAGGTVSRFDDINAPVDEFGRVLTTPGHYAFLRIAEGCDNWCAFCIIPKLRGKYRSRTMEHVLAEARQLADSGVKELIVIAQDITRYGMDWDGKPHLADLLEGALQARFPLDPPALPLSRVDRRPPDRRDRPRGQNSEIPRYSAPALQR